MTKEIKFSFLKDKPVSKSNGDFFHFYHDKFSPALKEIIENDSCVHTIGLFGRWGSGKSTIIDLLKEELQFKLFVFDAWKYQEDSLRRIFLIKLVDFLKLNGAKIEENILDPLYKGCEKTIDSKISDSAKSGKWNKIKNFFKKWWLYTLIVIFGIIWGILQLIASKDASFLIGVRDLAKGLFGLSAFSAILVPTFEKLLSESLNKIFSSVLPWSEVRTEVEKEERLNSPEQFELLFNKIIDNIDEKIIIVFDNIDRVQGDVAIKTLSTIKTFLDPVKKSDVVFIVPCDADAITEQIKTYYKDSVVVGNNFYPSEYLRKLFNVVIFTPEFIDADLEEYTKHLINQTGEIKDLLLNEDVILVITKAFSNNPREIKQFINNLISTVLIVSKTEIAEDILQEDKIAYLAKMLVLKQKFPKAYSRLKDNWYAPNNIIDDNPEPDYRKELTDFINNTSRITTDDVEPYIYFKKPEIASGTTSDSQLLRQYLLSSDADGFEKSFNEEANKDVVIDYVLLLLKKYQSQHGPLLNIFKTQFLVFSKNKYVIARKAYYDESLKILDNALWQDYQDFSTDLVFGLLLNNKSADKDLREKIIDRYILILSSEQSKQIPGKFLPDLFANIIKYQDLLSEDNVSSIRKSIEEFHFLNSQLYELFREDKDQEKFISGIAFRKFIDSIAFDKVTLYTPLIIQYKKYISDSGLSSYLLNKTQEWMTQETAASPDFRPEKEKLVVALRQIINSFRETIKDMEQSSKDSFAQAFTNAFTNVSDYNNRTIFINLMRHILIRLDEPKKSEYERLIQEYFGRASASSIKIVFEYWDKKSVASFIANYINYILPRVISDPELLGILYQFANKEQRVKIINHLIANAQDHGLGFIKTTKEPIPDRQEALKKLLIKSESVAISQREPIYKYVNEKFSIKDGSDIKDIAIGQIKSLLKNDDWTVQEVGFNFLNGATYLSESQKRDIAKDVLEFLRQPGKNINEGHRFSLKAISMLFSILQETPKRDYVYLLFDNIRKEKDSIALDVFLENIKLLSLSYVDFEKDFKDLLSRLNDWPDNDSKKNVIVKISELKSISPSKSEKEYWTEIKKIDELQEEK